MTTLPHPEKTLVTLAEARQWSPAACLIQRKLDGELSTRRVGNAVLLGELVRAKSGAFLSVDDRERIAAHGSFFAAFTVMELDGRNLLAADTATRWAALGALAPAFPADVVMVGQTTVPEAIPADVEGYVAHGWFAAWGEMQAVKQATIYTCRVTSVGNKQSVGIVDAATGVNRGRLTLNGGAVDRVRVGSIVRCEAMGEHDGGKLRQAVKCREFLVTF